MPARAAASKELAEVFKLLSHPDRIRLVEELRGGELSVGELANRLGLAPARVSQHLALLRAQRFVEERREGRLHHYHLTHTGLADWIVQALSFVEGRLSLDPALAAQARRAWTSR